MCLQWFLLILSGLGNPLSNSYPPSKSALLDDASLIERDRVRISPPLQWTQSWACC